ncbi:MAG: DsbA family protein/DNA-binding protein [Bacteroidales bacterium]
MKYRLLQRKNPQQPTAPQKYYASAVNEGPFSLKEFAREIEGRSSLTRGDIENVLDNFVAECPTFLMLGYSLPLGDLGTLRLSLQSDGVAEPKDFNVSHIRKVNVVFTPSVEFKEALKRIHLELEVLPSSQGGNAGDPGFNPEDVFGEV